MGIPVERTGALLVAWNEEQAAEFPAILERARANGSIDLREVDVDELYRREPHLGPGARGAIEVARRGARLPVHDAARLRDRGGAVGLRPAPLDAGRSRWRGSRTAASGSRCPAASSPPRHLVNAAGLRSDELDRMLGHDGFTVTPRRGELIVFDKLARPLVRHIVLAVPTKVTKGVLIAPTVFGNVMLGPTAEDVERKDDTDSTRAGLDYLMAEGGRIMPELLGHEVTAVYAGLRAATEHADYQLTVHAPEGYACVGGIRSTGLSASMAIAEHVREQLGEAGLRLEPRTGEPPEFRMPNIGEAGIRAHQSDDLIDARRRVRAHRLLLRARRRAARSATRSRRPCPPWTSTACAGARARTWAAARASSAARSWQRGSTLGRRR